MRVPPWLALFVLASACQPGDISVGDELDTPNLDGDTDVVVADTDVVVEDTDVPVDPHTEFDGATLVVTEPASAGIYRLVAGIPFSGYVVDAGGQRMPFDQLVWTPREDRAATFTGLQGASIVDAGIYTVDVVAAVPNGDNLRATIGGVRVQAYTAGVFSGDINITASTEVQGQTIQTNCIGAIDFEVDMAGKLLAGSGGCSLAIPLLGTIPLDFDLTGDIADPDITGQVLINVPFLQLPVDWVGGFSSADRVRGSFDADLSLFLIDGRIDAHRVSDYVTP